jgi:ornithine cyclodeaminase
MAMLGAGAMAFDQVMAVKEVRPIVDVMVWSRDPTHAADLAERVAGTPVEDAAEAVAAADVVSTATPSQIPLFDASVVRPGTHINAVGAFTPAMCEIPPEVVRAAMVIVDDLQAAAEEAGDLIQAGKHPDGTVADLMAGRHRGRSGVSEITFFKSVGIASQDVAAGGAALARAIELGLGIDLD